MALAIARVAAAIRPQGPCGGVVCEAWYLAEDVVRGVARRRQDWSSRLTQNRRRETASVHRREAHGWALQRPGPHLAVEALVPLIPAHAEHPVTVREQTSGCCTLGVRSPGLGQGRLGVSFAQESWTGRSVGRVTHRVDWRAAKSSSLSWQRWPPEPCEQDGKGPVGCHASRLRRADASGTQGCLVVVASALWHLTCRPAVPDRPQGLSPTMRDAGRQPGRAWLQRRLGCVHDPWSQGAPADHGLAP